MESNLEKYDFYKPSGFEWLGEVPEHWQTIKMKYIFRDFSQKNKPNEELLSVTQDQGVVPRSWVGNRMVMPSGDLDSFKYIEKGDFAISLRSFEGGLEYCYHSGIISPAYTVLKSQKPIYDPYYKYLFKSQAFISELQTSVVGIREGKNISYSELSYSFLPIPPFEEQQKIAEFLDQKTSQIDKAIALKERQIELLKEHQQIIIHKAVTRGLDENVPLKDSGIEWVGEIPVHWEVRRLASFGEFSKGGGISRAEIVEDGNKNAVLYGDIYTKYNISIKEVSNKITEETAKKAVKILKNDLLFTGSGETIEDIGKCVVNRSNDEVYVGGDVIIFTQSKHNSLFLSYVLNNEMIKQEKGKYSKGEIVVHIYSSKLRNLFLPLPSLSEQVLIARYLEIQTSKIAKAILLKGQEIERLKEYKSSLINSAVTGKIRVS